jgi:hypothetical protein
VRLDVAELFFDPDGSLKFKLKNGTVHAAVTPEGFPISISRQITAPAAQANAIKLYAKEVSGFLEAFARDNNSAEIQLTDQGQPAAPGGARGVFWLPVYDELKGEWNNVSGDTTLDLPTSLAPPPGQWCVYVVTVRIAAVQAQGFPSDGVETNLLVEFNDSPGTPDVRRVDAPGGAVFREGKLGFAPVTPEVTLNADLCSLAASGVLTLYFQPTGSPTLPYSGKYAIQVAGPFTHPEMINGNPS